MLFTESQLRTTVNPFSLLEEAVYLTEEEARIHPTTIPVLESSSIGGWKIPYNPLSEFCSGYGVGLLEAFTSICEQNGVDPSMAVLAIDEADLIEEPELVNESIPFVVAPISEYDPIYQMCEVVIKEYMETLNDGLLEALASPLNVNSDMSANTMFNAVSQKLDSIRKKGFDAILKAETGSQVDRINKAMEDEMAAAGQKGIDVTRRAREKKKAQLNQNSPKHASMTSSIGSKVSSAVSNLVGGSNSEGGNSSDGGGNSSSGGIGLGKKAMVDTGIAAAISGGVLAYRQYQNKPKSVIAKKIASLRKLYTKTMLNFKNAPNDGIKNKLKHVAAKILEVIDKLMGFLQKKADRR